MVWECELDCDEDEEEALPRTAPGHTTEEIALWAEIREEWKAWRSIKEVEQILRELEARINKTVVVEIERMLEWDRRKEARRKERELKVSRLLAVAWSTRDESDSVRLKELWEPEIIAPPSTATDSFEFDTLGLAMGVKEMSDWHFEGAIPDGLLNHAANIKVKLPRATSLADMKKTRREFDPLGIEQLKEYLKRFPTPTAAFWSIAGEGKRKLADTERHMGMIARERKRVKLGQSHDKDVAMNDVPDGQSATATPTLRSAESSELNAGLGARETEEEPTKSQDQNTMDETDDVPDMPSVSTTTSASASTPSQLAQTPLEPMSSAIATNTTPQQEQSGTQNEPEILRPVLSTGEPASAAPLPSQHPVVAASNTDLTQPIAPANVDEDGNTAMSDEETTSMTSTASTASSKKRKAPLNLDDNYDAYWTPTKRAKKLLPRRMAVGPVQVPIIQAVRSNMRRLQDDLRRGLGVGPSAGCGVM